MIIGAFVEARSCERFYALAPVVDDELDVTIVTCLNLNLVILRDYLWPWMLQKLPNLKIQKKIFSNGLNISVKWKRI